MKFIRPIRPTPWALSVIGWLLALGLEADLARASPAEDWNQLYLRIRDGRIERTAARQQIEGLHRALASAHGAPRSEACAFPVSADGPTDVGGRRGDGYRPQGYVFYAGNRHQGHPAHDLFIDDRDQDGRRDVSGQEASVLAHRPGVIVGAEGQWAPGSEQRGGNYVWVYSPAQGLYCYYAHLARLAVTLGERVEAGAVLGALGRTGKNAARRASPTHLHFMCLAFDQGRMSPIDPYPELLRCRASGRPAAPARGPTSAASPAPARQVGDILPPEGFARSPVAQKSFEGFLRALPLKAPGAPVLLHNGQPKENQSAHFAVVDLPIGQRDLEQCADAVIRLRAEFLFASGDLDRIAFRFVSGFRADYPTWAKGNRIQVQGDQARWVKLAAPSRDRQSFRQYLDVVFTYANTASLEKELLPVEDEAAPQIGDVFIQGGFPGHAVLVVDRAEDRQQRLVFLLAQSYMPAQEIHVLQGQPNISPWYAHSRGALLVTPEWTFRPGALRRFPSP